MYEGAPNSPGARPLLAHHRAAPRQHLLHRAHRHPRLRQAGASSGRRSTTSRACACWARWASRSTPRPGCGTTQVIGGERCPIVDTWWQTETGAIMITPLPGATPTKPGSGTLPFFGVVPDVVDKDGKPVPPGQGGYLVIRKPWPSMLRTIYGDPDRYVRAVLEAVPGHLLHRRRRAAGRGRLLLDHGPRGRRDQRRRPPPGHDGGRERAGLAIRRWRRRPWSAGRTSSRARPSSPS